MMGTLLYEVTTTFIKAGEDLNIQTKEGWTALAVAASSGHIDVVTTLWRPEQKPDLL